MQNLSYFSAGVEPAVDREYTDLVTKGLGLETEAANTSAVAYVLQFSRDPAPANLVWDLSTRAQKREKDSFYWLEAAPEVNRGVITASYDAETNTITVEPDADDSTILHEMIHLHEFLINDQPMYFHDMLYWALYRDLKDKIPKLDEIITGHAHLLTESSLFNQGGLHDILFLLKSFDLDIRMGYPLGTVFGYGRIDDFKGYDYVK